jgi:hypothetical protein
MLAILDNGIVLARVLANLHRQDLQAAGLGNGQYGFELLIPGGLSPLERHVISVQRECDGVPLPFSPMVIDPPSSFGAALEQALDDAVDTVPPGSSQTRMLSFLMAQTERLLQRSADTDGQRAVRQAWHDHRQLGGPKTPGAPPPDPGLRALVIDAVLPDAGRDAGSAALLSHMAALQQLGYSITLVASEDIASVSPALAASGIGLCTTPCYACVEEVLRRQADCFDIVYLRQAVIAARYLDLARRYQPRARILVSLPELRHRLLARQADAQANSALLAASWRFHAMECHAALSADAVLTHSPEEADLLRRAVPAVQLHRVPWHVPLLAERPALAKRRGVAFVAHFGNKANVDAAIWLAETIMPLVWERLPGLPCLIAGSAMPAAIRNLARPGITPLGYARDLAALFGQVRVAVAPMRYGAGVNGKVLGSLAAGVPCVMTPLAAEGLALPDILKKLVATDAPGLARLICDYHQDLAANREASRAGLSLIRKDWSATAVTSALQAALMERAAEQPHRSPRAAR